ncbi:putative transmembrane protein [Toxoplasma gondii VEG]|uniref:Putative transmembrane protein n=2 Tax=Toxoplasma gondii TaxID=5811 RepID=V5AWW8_TOXGV|nr:putative transmembrane protein [Toxoplasma gondii VEG]CEL78047.1 TPA: hypothetical protein BN1205_069750 [Toxoplasma gondii VEG]
MRRGRGQQARQGPASQPQGASGGGQGRSTHFVLKEVKTSGADSPAGGEGGTWASFAGFLTFSFWQFLSGLFRLSRLWPRTSGPTSLGPKGDGGAFGFDEPQASAAESDKSRGGKLLGVFLGRLWEWLAGVYSCAAAAVGFASLCLLTLWRLLCLQFCPRRRDYLLHAQGIAAIGKLAVAREQDENWTLSVGSAGTEDACEYMSYLINSTFFPVLPDFASTGACATVSPFSSSAAAGLWASLASLWPDFDDDYALSSLTRLTAALTVWIQSCRQLGTVLDLSPDFTGAEQSFFGAERNLAARAVDQFPEKNKSQARCCRRRASRASRAFAWFSRSQKPAGDLREGTAGLFPYLLWWRWWPAAAVTAIPRRTDRRQADFYSAPCYFPGVGRCVAPGTGPTRSSLEDYWQYARWMNAAEKAGFVVSSCDDPSCAAVVHDAPLLQLMQQSPHQRPVFAPLLFTPELFPAVFGGWLFPVTGNPSFAALPFFQTLWWPAAVAAAGGGAGSVWRVGVPGAAGTGWGGSSGGKAACSCARERRFCTSECAEKLGEEFGPGEMSRRRQTRPSSCLEDTLGFLPGGVPPVFLVNDRCVDSHQSASGGNGSFATGATGNPGRQRCSGSRTSGKGTPGGPAPRQLARASGLQPPQPLHSSSDQKEAAEKSGILQWLLQLWTGKWLFADACRFCSLNLRVDLRPPPMSFFLPLSLVKVGPSEADSERPGNPGSLTGSREGTCRTVRSHAGSSAGSSGAVPGASVCACSQDRHCFFYYANAMQRCTCDLLLPRRRDNSAPLGHDGLFIPVCTVRSGPQAGLLGARGGKQGGRGVASGAQTWAPSAAEAAAKFAQNQRQRLAHLPVHLHAAHCILGLTGVPSTAAAVDEAYCRQLVMVGDPLASGGAREGPGGRFRREKKSDEENVLLRSEDEENPRVSGLLGGSFAGLGASSWRREYVFRKSEEVREEGGSHLGPYRPRVEDFCDLLGVLHRARTAVHLFLALSAAKDRLPSSQSISPQADTGIEREARHPPAEQNGQNGTSLPSEETVRSKEGPTSPGGSEDAPSTLHATGAFSDLWSSRLFVPGPSAASFAARPSRSAAASEVPAADRGAEKNALRFSLPPASDVASDTGAGGRGSSAGSGSAVTSAYLRRRREDAQQLIQAFVVAACLARLRLLAAVQRFVTAREGPCSTAQQAELRRLLEASGDWLCGTQAYFKRHLTAQDRASAAAPDRLPSHLEYELSPHPVAVAVRENFPLLVRMLLADEAAASVFTSWRGRHGSGTGACEAGEGTETMFELLTHPWMFSRGYSVLADLGNGSTVLHFAARFGCTDVLQVVACEVAPTTWWRCMIHRNHAGHTPLDVAILWHGVESEVTRVFAHAFERAKEVQGYTRYLNCRNVCVVPFLKAVVVVLIAAFIPARVLLLPFFFSLFGDEPADESALRLALLVILFLAEFVVRQAGCGEKLFALYAGLAVGTAFSLGEVISDLTHDVLVEEIYGESAVRVAFLLLFFHYAATPSAVARVCECIGETGPTILGFFWRPLRRWGVACGVGTLSARILAWLSADNSRFAEEKLRSRGACHPELQSANRTHKATSSASCAGAAGTHGEGRGGTAGGSGGAPTEEGEGGIGRLARLRRRCVCFLAGVAGVLKSGWAALHHSCDFRFLLRVVGLSFLLMSLTSSMISGWWLVTDDFTYAIFALSGADRNHGSHTDEALRAVRTAGRPRRAVCPQGLSPNPTAESAVASRNAGAPRPAAGASEAASRYPDERREFGTSEEDPRLFEEFLDLEEGGEFDFMPPPSFELCHASLSSSSLLLSLQDVAGESFKQAPGANGAANLLSFLDRYPFVPEKAFVAEAVHEQGVEDETYGEVCRRWKAEQQQEFEAGAQAPRTSESGAGGEGGKFADTGFSVEGERRDVGSESHGNPSSRRDQEGAENRQGRCRKLSQFQEQLLGFSRQAAGPEITRGAPGETTASPLEDGVCVARTPGPKEKETLGAREPDAAGPHATRTRRARQRVCAGGRCSAHRVLPTASVQGSMREKLEEEQADELCRWHLETEVEVEAGHPAASERSPLSLQLMSHCVKRLENKLRKQIGLPAVDDESFYHAFRSRLAVRLLQPDALEASEEEFARSVLPFVCLGCTEFDDVTGACLARDMEKRRRRQRQAMRCLHRVRTWHLQHGLTADRRLSDETPNFGGPGSSSDKRFYDSSGLPFLKETLTRDLPPTPKTNFGVVSGYNYYQLYRPHPEGSAGLAGERGRSEEALRLLHRQKKATALLSPPRWSMGLRRFSGAAFAGDKGAGSTGGPVTAALDAAATVGAMVAALCSFLDVDDAEMPAEESRPCPNCAEQIVRVQQIREGLRCYRQLVLQILEKQRRPGSGPGKGEGAGKSGGEVWSWVRELKREGVGEREETRPLEPDSEELLLSLLAMQRSGLLTGAKKLLRDGVVTSPRRKPFSSPDANEPFRRDPAPEDRPAHPAAPGPQARASSPQRPSASERGRERSRGRSRGSGEGDTFAYPDRPASANGKKEARRLSWFLVFAGLAVTAVGSTLAWLLYQCWVERCAEWYSRQLEQEEDGLRASPPDAKRGNLLQRSAAAAGKGSSGRGRKAGGASGGARSEGGAGQAPTKKASKNGKGTPVSGTVPGRLGAETRSDAAEPATAGEKRRENEGENEKEYKKENKRENEGEDMEKHSSGPTPLPMQTDLANGGLGQQAADRESETKLEREALKREGDAYRGPGVGQRVGNSRSRDSEEARALTVPSGASSREGTESGETGDVSFEAAPAGTASKEVHAASYAASSQAVPSRAVPFAALSSDGRGGARRKRKSDGVGGGDAVERRESRELSSSAATKEDCGFVAEAAAQKISEKKAKALESSGVAFLCAASACAPDACAAKTGGNGLSKAGPQRPEGPRPPPASSQTASAGVSGASTRPGGPRKKEAAPGAACSTAVRKKPSLSTEGKKTHVAAIEGARSGQATAEKARQRTGEAEGRCKAETLKEALVASEEETVPVAGAPQSVWAAGQAGLGGVGRCGSADLPNTAAATAAETEQVCQLQKLLAALHALNASYDLSRCQLPDWALDCLDEAQAVKLRERHGWKVVKQRDGAQEQQVFLVPEKVVQRFLQTEQASGSAVHRGALAPEAPEPQGQLSGSLGKDMSAAAAVFEGGRTAGKERSRMQCLTHAGEETFVGSGGAGNEPAASLRKKKGPAGKAKAGTAAETVETAHAQQSPGRWNKDFRKALTGGAGASDTTRVPQASFAPQAPLEPLARTGASRKERTCTVGSDERSPKTARELRGVCGPEDREGPAVSGDALHACDSHEKKSHRASEQASSACGTGKSQTNGERVSGDVGEERLSIHARVNDRGSSDLRPVKVVEAAREQSGVDAFETDPEKSDPLPLHVPADLIGDDFGPLHTSVLHALGSPGTDADLGAPVSESNGPRGRPGLRAFREGDREGLELAPVGSGCSRGFGGGLPGTSRKSTSGLGAVDEQHFPSSTYRSGLDSGGVDRMFPFGSVCDDLKPAHELLAAALLHQSHASGYGSEGGWLPFASAPSTAFLASPMGRGGPSGSGAGSAARSERQLLRHAEHDSTLSRGPSDGEMASTGLPEFGSRGSTRSFVHTTPPSVRSSLDDLTAVDQAWLYLAGGEGLDADPACGPQRLGRGAGPCGEPPGLGGSEKRNARWLDYLGGEAGDKSAVMPGAAAAAAAAVGGGREEMLAAVERSFSQEAGTDLPSTGADVGTRRTPADAWGDSSARGPLPGFGPSPVAPRLDLSAGMHAIQARGALSRPSRLGNSEQVTANTASAFTAFFSEPLADTSPTEALSVAALRPSPATLADRGPTEDARAASSLDLLAAELDPVAVFLAEMRQGSAESHFAPGAGVGRASQDLRGKTQRVVMGTPAELEKRTPTVNRRERPSSGFGEDAGEFEQGLRSVLSWAESVLEDEAGDTGSHEFQTANSQERQEARADREHADEEDKVGSAASSPSKRTGPAEEAFSTSTLLQELAPESLVYPFASSQSRHGNSASLGSSSRGVEGRFSSGTRPTKSAEGVCLLCRLAPPSCVLEPCGHRVLCASCASMLCSDALPDAGGADRGLARKAAGAVCMHCLEEVSHIWFQ